MSGSVVVGDVVHWFVRGNTSAPPLPGLVTVAHPGGMLSLTVWDENSTPFTKRCVWHADSPQVKSSPKLAEKAGVWRERRPAAAQPDAVVTEPVAAPVAEEPAMTQAPEPTTREAIEVARKKALQSKQPA